LHDRYREIRPEPRSAVERIAEWDVLAIAVAVPGLVATALIQAVGAETVHEALGPAGTWVLALSLLAVVVAALGALVLSVIATAVVEAGGRI
jgi:amino acid transporter